MVMVDTSIYIQQGVQGTAQPLFGESAYAADLAETPDLGGRVVFCTHICLLLKSLSVPIHVVMTTTRRLWPSCEWLVLCAGMLILACEIAT